MDLLEKCRAYMRADEARDVGLYPYYPAFQGPAEGGQAVLDGAEVCMLGSNNYRALSVNMQVIGAAQDAIALYGTSATGSRLLNGNLDLHEELEADLADFFGYEAALVFATGYMTNLGVVSALAGSGDLVYLDEKAHASLIDGARLAKASGAVVRWFGHNDPGDLARQLAAAPTQSVLVATDGVFSMEGDLAPVSELVAICEEYGATLLVDDAHGVGVFGRGRGVIEQAGMQGRVPLMTLTFGKSLASQGGAVLADAKTIDFLRHTSRPQIFSAGLSPADTAAAHAALREIRRRADAEPDALAAAEHLRRALDALGYDVAGSASPVLRVRFPDQVAMLSAQRILVDHGVYTNAVLPPACEGYQLRIACTDAHTPDVLEAAIGVFASLREDLLPRYRQAA
ncbi:aminotransferase class I/II-fold pyridoxal phosphate-dependent enzyme [Streptomyces sp. NBC_01142]|uniref:aminotransferase class I/II-fold pyridoxal phosphate-dependent enzyme n=1 Tax=Streptomyces sp. NBC_01142 TaxID=2975865 RepID=UPI00224EA465|nr:aminotransferase class I/II-fold pyridoxal phosphate-dependent enzyme [Streptomyces sp. NBC_01142]MCX4826371.1 aminotransferase class I/II-fold pyridoxal phosphate-dependent enzyme [Streptomyces sp. NBC_01142]